MSKTNLFMRDLKQAPHFCDFMDILQHGSRTPSIVIPPATGYNQVKELKRKDTAK